MGCDVHIYLVTSRDSGESWQLDEGHTVDEDGWLKQVHSNRYYELFGYMAGVRCMPRDNHYEPRGFPEWAPKDLKKHWKYHGEHTPSWLTLTEFKRCVLKSGIKIPKDAEPVAFYDWSKSSFEDTPGYENLVRFCERKLDDLKAEHILLGDPHKVELRIIFWFDS